MANEHVDVVIVGAGAGGGVVAKELSAAGLSVVLFERGDWVNYSDHRDDELTSQRGFPLKPFFGPDMQRYRRVAVDRDGTERIVYPNEWAYGNIAACVGSGTVAYGAMAWRFMQEDFTMKSTYGEVEGSSLADWPIGYQDLEPYYEKAEWEIGVSGDDSKNPFAPPRKKPHPMPAFGHNREARILEAGARKAGFHPFSIPMLRNSEPYQGRGQCIHVRNCVGFACRVNAKNGTHNTVIPTALATGNCDLRVNCKVAKILTNSKGRVTGVSYFDEHDQLREQTADIVVLAASATETPRLLLNSASTHHPNGIGNKYDWVGRNLQDHAYTGADGLFAEDIYDDVGPGASVAICDFAHNNPGIVGGAMLANDFIPLPYAFTKVRPPGSARWGRDHKEFQRRNFHRRASIRGPIQEMPNFESRVQVSDEVRDHWGIPVVKLSGYRLDQDMEAAKFIADKAAQWLEAAGAVDIWKSLPGLGVGASQHQAGTCRMGDDPQSSVTNKYGQVHGIDNLYIADGSLHVTNGAFNPVLTIMALGYWVSEHILKEHGPPLPREV
ncbi:GMC family oxidoreductase [Marinimicrobium sp. ABcell2]|uniref:GMC family oxidoreductase n=1 Tax=Marinimicrobium sp. ABcell2 TaxID=3069751 RepID=UPI0027B0F36A|nr:GMC family oxidoreductase [Marinimicrobium sp. ABcell2]MDQ2077969.1 GMC family oxidoreductase [Marinimicrobium sp. ABcell2]